MLVKFEQVVELRDQVVGGWNAPLPRSLNKEEPR
jgi:hypothetical protein